MIYETCESSDGPVIFTGHSRNIWVDFVANRNSSGRGFQISFLTIEGNKMKKKNENNMQQYLYLHEKLRMELNIFF